jgi:hypothetical protein
VCPPLQILQTASSLTSQTGVLSEGEIKVSDKVTLRRVALVQSLGFNLLSVPQLLDEGFEVLFQPGGS